MNRLIKIIIASKAIQVPLNFSKKLILPGFDGLSIFEVLKFFFDGIKKSSLTMRASSLAFRFFLALFPSIIFLFALIPYIPIDNFKPQLLELIQSVLPEQANELANTTIEEIVNKGNGKLLSFGFLFALYLASDGVNSMIMAFNNSYHAIRKGSYLKRRLRSLLLLAILTLLMVSAIGLIVFSETFTMKLVHGGFLETNASIYLLKFGKIVVLLLLFFMGISSIYYYGNINSTKFRFISAGSTLATLLSILLSSGFAYYVNNFASYNKVYGSIGTLMVIMLWLYFNSLVLLIGFELNASISHAKEKKINNLKT